MHHLLPTSAKQAQLTRDRETQVTLQHQRYLRKMRAPWKLTIDTQNGKNWKEIHFPNISKPLFLDIFGIYLKVREGTTHHHLASTIATACKMAIVGDGSSSKSSMLLLLKLKWFSLPIPYGIHGTNAICPYVKTVKNQLNVGMIYHTWIYKYTWMVWEWFTPWSYRSAALLMLPTKIAGAPVEIGSFMHSIPQLCWGSSWTIPRFLPSSKIKSQYVH